MLLARLSRGYASKIGQTTARGNGNQQSTSMPWSILAIFCMGLGISTFSSHRMLTTQTQKCFTSKRFWESPAPRGGRLVWPSGPPLSSLVFIKTLCAIWNRSGDDIVTFHLVTSGSEILRIQKSILSKFLASRFAKIQSMSGCRQVCRVLGWDMTLNL